MPKALQYRAGSVIYFQGDTADKIFILQTGKVNLVYQDIETGQDVHDLVQPGEFFGVKSALGRYAREENAIAFQDASIMAFSVPEFEQLAMANIRIIMKMLKVFSNQMRRIHKQVSSLMEKEEQQSPEMGLFNVGEYYLKNKRFSQAKYVFSRYLTYYPSGRNALLAAKNLEIAENSLTRYGNGKGPAPAGHEGPVAPASAAPAAPAPAPGRPAGGGLAGGGDLNDTAKAYYDAVSFISQEKFQQAYLAFKKIIDAKEDAEYVAKSSYEIGRCLYLLGKFDDCIKHYTMMITAYPKHPDLGDALFFMGQSYEKKGRKDQAATFYKKILTMSTDDEDAINMKARRALKALEA
ncbi:MAG: cyclic nucleotide-binding domain-containing protein [Spirochaetaceae bacterium]|jgi:CRP-like cAMP-binding protein|nr:cyclic nucleotide-binding domain-containing protein [Spirochaetaceae bacterium]